MGKKNLYRIVKTVTTRIFSFYSASTIIEIPNETILSPADKRSVLAFAMGWILIIQIKLKLGTTIGYNVSRQVARRPGIRRADY